VGENAPPRVIDKTSPKARKHEPRHEIGQARLTLARTRRHFFRATAVWVVVVRMALGFTSRTRMATAKERHDTRSRPKKPHFEGRRAKARHLPVSWPGRAEPNLELFPRPEARSLNKNSAARRWPEIVSRRASGFAFHQGRTRSLPSASARISSTKAGQCGIGNISEAFCRSTREVADEPTVLGLRRDEDGRVSIHGPREVLYQHPVRRSFR